ncbi:MULTISPECIES: hypothetical protein [Paenibacillus]|uniref:hypothetical protein n=1 Tax=Paenibacillus TaxID=44249 RepID=UPI0022B88476|nr:hypothetical protein [Paenibacillus caseinilyticus]MCZ8518001.1 hypothetical protein [Paenibacillus caseinilyticus]
MNHVWIRPDLKTAGGEVNDILYKNRYVGTLTLVYRESDRVAGSIQLEQEVLTAEAKDEVYDHVHSYVQSLVGALRAKECEVMVTYSSFDHVIATEGADSLREGLEAAEEDFDYDTEWIDTDTRLEDDDPYERDELTLGDLELVLVGEAEDAVEYHIYDGDEDWVAEAFLQIEDREVSGTVHWMIEPEDDILDAAADLLVLDFDEDEVDTFVIHMLYDNEIIETIELTHEDLLDESDEDSLLLLEDDEDEDVFTGSRDHTIVLARDDGDVLTYEIYQQSSGGLPIGTATVDISDRQLTGFIDFREPGHPSEREEIAALLMEELDKEKDYEAINLSMMHRSRVIEEVLFETESFH